MENILETLKEKWEASKKPLEVELESIKKQEEDLKMHHGALVRQKGAQARLCEIKVLELEAEGEFSKSDTMKAERVWIEESIVELSQDYEKKLVPLEENRLHLEDKLKELPRKILDGEFPKIREDALKTFDAGLVGLESAWQSIKDFEAATGGKFIDDRYLKKLQIFDHKLFNESKEIWKRLKKWVGTPI